MASATLTSRELEIIVAVASFVKSTGVPWAEVAKKANFNTAKQARDKYAAAVNKLKASVESAQEDGPSAAGTPTPSSGKKASGGGSTAKKRKGAGENNAETPSKKGRKTKEVSPSPSPNPVADEDDDEAMNVKAELEETEEMFKTGCENPEEMFS